MSLKDKLNISDLDNENLRITQDLLKLANDIEEFSESHLKRVFQILTEFDLHDESHSKKVINNIERILGNKIIDNLSIYDAFFLYVSSYLHDCAMAPAEWEINLMRKTEGTELFYENESSLKNDLKPIFNYQHSLSLVSTLWDDLNINLEWLFCPNNEEELKKELAILLIEYQEYRNGYKTEIENIKNNEEFRLINKDIRVDFIRKNHHLRAEKYIKNSSKHFCSILSQGVWGKKMANDLAIICRAHGEDIDYIHKLDRKSSYIGSQHSNLQFIAMMLRLGDIIHYSYDRAPDYIYKGKVFESEHSFHEWAIKNNGVNYDINDGLISFKAYCTNPNDYFRLHKYIDYIDIEIQNFFILSRQWDERYRVKLEEKVDRTGVSNDRDVFLPTRGLSFKLNQKQIIELLMGVGLYKDKYACLREIYQNSLDACRSLRSLMGKNGVNKEFKIEFGIERKKEGTYLYCHDNGIGMNSDIIHNYLLNIGNSYYKSSRFYREQANSSGEFTPTSQFGIGILSCFMLGSRIDISTKRSNEKLISCSIEGPHESFYYRESDIYDKELIGDSGTIIRILLNKSVANEISDHEIKNIHLTDIAHTRDYEFKNLPDTFKQYNDLLEQWTNHLFYKIDNFICSTFDKISVAVRVKKSSEINLINKPYVIDYKALKLNEHIEFIDYLYRERYESTPTLKYSEIIELIKYYPISVEHEGTIFNFFLFLPVKKNVLLDLKYLNTIPVSGNRKSCIDGISIEDRNLFDINGILDKLHSLGSINFTGKLRPQLSVDRTSIISVPKELEEQADIIITKLIDSVLEITNSHIEDEKIEFNSETFNICVENIFHLFGFYNKKLLPAFISNKLGASNWRNISTISGIDMDVKTFITAKEIEIMHPNKIDLDLVTKSALHSRLLNSEKIIVDDNSIKIISRETNELQATMVIYNKGDEYSHSIHLFPSDEWNVKNSDYDIITSALPIIPRKLFNCLRMSSKKNENHAIIHDYSNGISAFFTQEALLVHPKMGLFTVENDMFGQRRKKSNVFNFEKRRQLFHLTELESINSNKNIHRTFIYIYLTPSELTEADKEHLHKLTNENEYLDGVKNGWSILITGMKENNLIIESGIKTRDHMLKLIPKTFWNSYSNYKFNFCDGTEIVMKNHTDINDVS